MGNEETGHPHPGTPGDGESQLTYEQLFTDLVRERGAEWVRQQLNRPQESLGGLTPDQAYQLVECRAGDAGCPLQLAEELGEEELLTSRFLRNVRLFVKSVEETGAVKTTAKGNLSRNFVREMAQRLELDQFMYRMLQQFKPAREEDVSPLHEIRVICEVAGLLFKRKGYFRVSKRGRAMLSAPPLALYRHLFRTYFYRYNIAYRWRGPHYPEIQDNVNLALYRLGQICEEWNSTERITEQIYLRGLKMEEGETLGDYWALESAVDRTFLDPLQEFGLLEVRRKKTSGPSPLRQYRVTPLFPRFLIFHWPSQPGSARRREM